MNPESNWKISQVDFQAVIQKTERQLCCFSLFSTLQFVGDPNHSYS